MKKSWIIPLTVLLTAAAAAAPSFHKSESETIEETIAFTGAESSRLLTVDNLFGSVRIITHEGKDVLLKAAKTIQADSERDLEKARREVTLDILRENGEVGIIVNGPFRNRDGPCNWNRSDYIVKYDFDIRVPRGCDLKASTVNRGDIAVQGLSGRFKIRNVNGKIIMKNITGSGKASTVNGSIEVGFSQSPPENCSFQTVNGDVEIRFAKDPSADFWCKTFNGSVYSDFDITRLPAKHGEGRREKGVFIYQSNDFRGLRIGRGGSEIRMDSLNGDLRIASGKNNQEPRGE